MLKIIKSKKDYIKALEEIEKYIDIDPEIGSTESDYLELLTLLVKDYESKSFKMSLPDPVEAIKFRMEQQNLTQRDLVPYLGNRSKVSEVLSKKRPLTLSMIRSLHENLGIPAQVLLQEQDISLLEERGLDWKRFPLKEMIFRKWIDRNIENINDQAEEIIRNFIKPIGAFNELLALYRKTNNIRSARSMDQYSLTAWTARIFNKYIENPLDVGFKKGTVNLEFLKKVAQLSWSDNGPLLAKEFLFKNGIALIVESHLPKTYLDGAVLISKDGKPIIGLTLRHDRIDNFWFTLMHELAHISLHLDNDCSQIYDDLDFEDNENSMEIEADELASEALIPSAEWEKSPASRLKSPEAAESLAKKLGIHPAIVAGRMRHEFKAYRLLNNLIGHKKVRILFDNVIWGN